MIPFGRLLVSNTIVRRGPQRTSVVFPKAAVRLMNTKGLPTGATPSFGMFDKVQTFSARNKDTVGIFVMLITGIYGGNLFLSRITAVETKLETELKNMKENTVRKDVVAKLEKELENTVRKEAMVKLETELQYTVRKDTVAKLETEIKNMAGKDVVAKLESKLDARTENF